MPDAQNPKDNTIKATINNSDLYSTTDLYLSAYLIVKGHKFSYEKIAKKASFTFKKTQHLDEHVNEYLMGDGSTIPSAYANAIKNLKNLLFNK